jgi:hypothetical protein
VLRHRRAEALRDAARVRALPGGLPADEREAVVLCYFGGYTQREVAVLTDTPAAAVSARLLSALRRLQEWLDGRPAEPRPADHRAEEERVVGWVLHALEPGDEQEAAAHLDRCAPCRALARAYEAVLARLVVALPGDGSPPEVRDAVRRQVGAAPDAAPAGDRPGDHAGPGAGQPEQVPPERGPRHPEAAGAVPLDRVQRAVVWSGLAVLLAVTIGLGVWLLVRRG